MHNSLSLAEHDQQEHRVQRQSPGTEELFENYFEAVHRYFSRRITSPEDAQDLTAETFAATIGSNVPRNVEPLSWLYGIARRKLADHLRRQRRSLAARAHCADPSITSRGNSLRELVDALPFDQREALQLQVLEDLSIQQIAIVMKRSPGSVKALLQRAKERVRLELNIEEKI